MSHSAPTLETSRRLGSGATGTVDLVELQTSFGDWPAGSQLALKRLHEHLHAQPEALSAFEREVEAVRAVDHPHLATFVWSGSQDGTPCLLTEYIPGRTLAEELEEHGVLDEPHVRAIGEQVAGALAALAGAGWIHGDVKPDNVRMTPTGRCVLLDLGFARKRGTVPEHLPGTVAYIAPETLQHTSLKNSADVFALGVLLFELATGAHPYVAAQDWRSLPAEELLEALATNPAHTPSVHIPQLSPFFDEFTLALVARDPRKRPSADSCAAILRKGEDGEWWKTRRAQVQTFAHDLPLIGRAVELEQLRSDYADVVDGDGGSLVWLTGEAGSGKSRLVRHFIAHARLSAAPPLYLYGRCSGFQESRPAEPLFALLGRWLNLPPETAPNDRQRARLEALLPAEAAAALLSALDPNAEPTQDVSIVWALATWLRLLGRQQPVVVFLDDLDRAGGVTLEVLSRLMRELEQTTLLLVLGLRSSGRSLPELVSGLVERASSQTQQRTIELRPLAQADILELVETLFAPSQPRLRIARILFERSGGNVGHVSELLSSLQARRLIRTDVEGRYLLTIPAEEIPRPRSLEKVVAERYRELMPSLQLWLQRIAVVGGRIEPGLLERSFAPGETEQVIDVLERLVEQGWLVATDDRYRFARPAQREAVYLTIGSERRKRMHAQAAAALAEDIAAGRRGAGLEFQLAFHYKSAEAHEALLGVLQTLVETTRSLGLPQRTLTLCRWGMESLAELEPSEEHEALRVRWLTVATDAADRHGDRAQQRQLLDALSDLPLDLEAHPDIAGTIYLLHGRYSASVGKYGIARGMLLNAGSFFEAAGDEAGHCAVLCSLASIHEHVGQMDEAKRLAHEAAALAPTPELKARATLARGMNALQLDEFENSLRAVDQVLNLLRHAPATSLNRGVRARAYMLRARTYRLAGRPRRALAALERATRLGNQAGERRLEAEIQARMGRMLLDLHREDEAELLLRDALLTAREIEYGRGAALASVFLGTLLAENGREGARTALADACSFAHEIGLKRIESLTLAILARAARERGDSASADRDSASAYELLRQHGAELSDRIVISATRSLILSEAGQASAARDLERDLDRKVRRVNGHIGALILRQRHRRATSQLLEAARSPDGPVYPRIRLSDLPARLTNPGGAAASRIPNVIATRSQ